MSQYMFVASGPITWTAARDAAVASGGQLISVNDTAEDAFVRAVLAENEALWGGEPRDTARNGPWIGLSQPAGSSEPGGGWTWLDGTAATFNGWHSGQPDNFIADSVGLYWDNDGQIGWADHIDDPVLGGYGPVISYAVEYSDAKSRLDGGAGRDFIFAGDIANRIRAGGGADVIDGGGGADTLSGGKGRDRFVFETKEEADGDRVSDLGGKDTLDFSGIDAHDGRGGNQRFSRVAEFTGHAAELTISFDGADTRFSGDTDGDGVADFVVFATGDHTGFGGLTL